MKPATRKKAKQKAQKKAVVIEAAAPPERDILKPIYETALGSMYCGDSKKILADKAIQATHGKAQLIFTSPPFPLNAKKKYGNLNGDEYIAWLATFAPLLKEMLQPDGSIVIEIGNAWEPGRPVMSTVVLKALLQFLETGGLHLCQEFVWYNPARLPSPVQWVNIERIRVKDAFTRIWWMSPTDRPKADNRRVLREYSASMKNLIKTRRYNAGKRPSEHQIGKKSFFTDNQGSIPPNVQDGDLAPSLSTLLKGAHTRSTDGYLQYCREHDFNLHPARMPDDLVKFFVKFLTEENDLVLDPFGGSNTTGATAEGLGRRWLSCEETWGYASTSIARFDPANIEHVGSGIALKRASALKSSTQKNTVSTARPKKPKK